VDRAFRRGLCILGAGENTLRLSPPLLIDREQADVALAVLEQCIQEVEGKI
jgi:4-aminobutyrate aminotransferase